MTKERFTSLVDMQEKSCAAHAERPLFGTKVNGEYAWLTYKEFAEQVDKFRGALAKLGVKRGQKVAVISNNRVEWAVGAYATYGLGAHYVPMYEAQLPKDWTYILNDSSTVVLLAATKAVYEQVKDFPSQIETLEHVICFEGDASETYSFAYHLAIGADNPTPSVQPSGDEVAGLIYTSGTTGEPKGVVLSHGNFVSNVNAVHDIFPMSADDVSCSFLPWAHSFGQTVELHVLLSMGASLGIAESVQTLLSDIGAVRPTILFAVPRIFNRIYDGVQKKMEAEGGVKRFLFERGLNVAKQRRELAAQGQKSAWVEWQYNKLNNLVFSKIRDRFGGRLRYAFSGGAALSKEVGTFVDDIGIEVYEGYGLTETSPIATANTPEHRRIGTIGKPIPGVEIHICDEEQNVLPPDTDGEIVVIGPNVMQGYHNRPEDTDEVIFDLDGKRAFRTGDMGRTTEDGFVMITGRFKEQYKLENGKYVVPSPLEELLKLSGFINQAFVYGDNKRNNICLVVPDFDALIGWAKEQGIADTSPASLVENPKAIAKIGDELMRYSTEFKPYERPVKWALLTDEFTTENDMLTPKMSVKRRNVIETYRDVIDGLYAALEAEAEEKDAKKAS